MNNKEYLNEEKYQKTSKKLSKFGLPLLIIGIISFISAIPLSFVSMYIGMILGPIGVFATGIGFALFTAGKNREINAYFAQQQMPVVKEGIEKVAPSVGVAAKEISKGVKEGLKDEDRTKE